MKTPKLIFGLCLILLFGTIPFTTKSQTGSLDVCVHCIGGDGIAGAIISVSNLYIDTTNVSGCVNFSEIPVGTWNVTCEIEGYNIPSSMVEIIEGITTQSNFELYCPIFIVDPLNIEAWLEPNQQTTEIITLSNPGLESVDWSAYLEVFPPDGTDDFLDVQFMYPLSGTTGEKGIECDGKYFWVTTLGNEVYKYALDGTLIETFPGFSFTDMAFNGTYFYGGTGSTTIYEVDLYNQAIIVSTFTAPGNVRAIAYNHDENIFYGYSWGGNIIAFDPTGALLGSAPIGPSKAVYSGFAYDNVTEGGPYLWGYGLTGSELNVLVQLQLPSLQETGFTVNLDSLLGVPLNNVSGGLFTHPEILPDIWTLGGVVTDEWIWGLELAEIFTWISIEPTSGTLEPGESEEMLVYLDATGIPPWIYEAEIQFNTIPNVGSPVVEVLLGIEGQPWVQNLQAETNCTDVILNWETMPPGMPADSFHVYKDSIWYATTFDTQFVDSLVFPETERTYYATGYFYNGWESNQTNHVNVTVPLPDSLEPLNLDILPYYPQYYDISLWWDEPNSCLPPDGYNVYRDGEKINSALVTELTYIDPGSALLYSITYHVTAMYYFGESGFSNSAFYANSNIESSIYKSVLIFPNPTKNKIFIQSSTMMNRIEIFNNIRMSVLTEHVNSDAHQLNVSGISPGIYFIKIETEQDMIVRKILIE